MSDSLTLETAPSSGVRSRVGRREDLVRLRAATETKIVGAIDLLHTPGAQRAEELVCAEASLGGERHAAVSLSPKAAEKKL